MKFSRQEYWSGLPFPYPGIFLTRGLNLGLLHCRKSLDRLNHQGSQSGSSKNSWLNSGCVLKVEPICFLNGFNVGLDKEREVKGTYLEVQWFKHHSSTAGGEGSIPGKGTKILHAEWPKS